MTDQWTLVENQKPPAGVTVETISPGGLQSQLKLIDGLWFFPDASMYVYYTPMFWRHV